MYGGGLADLINVHSHQSLFLHTNQTILELGRTHCTEQVQFFTKKLATLIVIKYSYSCQINGYLPAELNAAISASQAPSPLQFLTASSNISTASVLDISHLAFIMVYLLSPFLQK